MPYPTPHLDKLSALLENEKLPEADKARVIRSVENYKKWIASLDAVTGSPAERIAQLVKLLNDYRFSIDVELIFDSEADFLYRQKGQLKLDNSVIEEFLPRLIDQQILPALKDLTVLVGPRASFSSLFFVSSLAMPQPGGGVSVREKNQDFAISRPLYIRTSHSPKFESSEVASTNITYVAAECKTNLDKTMFQEACATARDTKLAVSGAKYYLLCEWLDMPPVSTAATDIDEIILLRKAKRLNSNIRNNFATFAGRKKFRDRYIEHLRQNPFRLEMFERFISHVESLLTDQAPEERDVLEHGFF
ncbi:MAG: Bpu10I family restriction endonuclease [Terriglobales bacterium]